MITNGPIYSYKKKREKYTAPLKKCIEGTVADLLSNPTDPKRPGMLLGKVQAGKTFAFSGIMSLAMDNGYDLFIVLTKGTKLLLKQTVLRMESEFDFLTKEQDELEVFDIMTMPKLTGYQLEKKIIIAVKKEDDNLMRMNKVILEDYPELADRKILVVDDEADFASIGFRRTREEGMVMNTTTRELTELRSKAVDCDFLQVTATPYSLYLQPEDYEATQFDIAPMRPAFTYVVPTHDRYIGADAFYGDTEDVIFSRLMSTPFIQQAESQILNRVDSIRLYSDPNYAEYYLSHNGIPKLWSGLLGFIVGVTVRRLQAKINNETPKKYAFIIHTNTQKLRHEWQGRVVSACLNNMAEIAEKNASFFRRFIDYFMESFREGMEDVGGHLPEPKAVKAHVLSSLKKDYVGTYLVNSDADLESIIDSNSGQLKLINPMNIFIGGYIFDRGVTIDNLIGFYYARSPRSYQQDSVIQHQRVFGARDRQDLAVTRYYTTQRIHTVLRRMHQFDTAMWEHVSAHGTADPIYFVGQEGGLIRPCSPNKIMLSDVNIIRPQKRILPVGFQTLIKRKQAELSAQINTELASLGIIKAGEYQIETEKLKKLLKLIWKSFVFDSGYELALDEFTGILNFLLSMAESSEEIHIVYRADRNIGRIRASSGRFEDSPDSPRSTKGELQTARRLAAEKPVLILTHQKGEKAKGWNGASFYWPILVAQQNINTTVYSK